MRKRSSGAIRVGFVALSFVATTRLVACSSGDDSNSPGGDAGAVDGQTNFDGEIPSDAAVTETSTNDGSTQSFIQCGTAQCDRVAETCCVPVGVDTGEADGGIAHTPPDAGPYCKANVANEAGVNCGANELERSCLDSTDCPSGLACLGVFGVLDGTGVANTFCGPADEFADAQTNFHELCRDGSECADAAACVPYECQGNPIGSCGELNTGSDCTSR